LSFVLEEIETNGEITVTNIKEDDIIATIAWHMFQDCVDQIAMGIYQTQPFACDHIRFDHIGQKGGFSCSSFPNHIDMSHLVLVSDTKSHFFSFEVGISQHGDIVFL